MPKNPSQPEGSGVHAALLFKGRKNAHLLSDKNRQILQVQENHVILRARQVCGRGAAARLKEEERTVTKCGRVIRLLAVLSVMAVLFQAGARAADGTGTTGQNAGQEPEILSVTPVGDTAVVRYQGNVSEALIEAAVYDLETGQMLACGSTVPAEGLGVALLSLKGTVPDRYELRAFLLHRQTLAPLGAACAFVKDGQEFWNSGSPDLSKLSKEEICALLADNPLSLPDEIYQEVPSLTAPYTPGKLSEEALQSAAGRLSALRRLAGLPEAVLSQELCESAQHGAVLLCASGVLSHTPSMPADMDLDFYREGYFATNSSNLSWGSSLTEAVDGFMSDANNLSPVLSVGHRRWQLSPFLGRIGFGVCGSYVAELVTDTSGRCEYDFISWPASGNFPSELFQQAEEDFRSPIWSVSLNPQKFGNISNASVLLANVSEGRSWLFDASTPSEYFQIEFDSVGIPNCITFTPGVTAYSGQYEVTIFGLTCEGEETVLTYQVDFFNAEQLASGHIAYPTDGGNLYFDPDTGCVVAADLSVRNAVIPAEINGIPVTSIGQRAFMEHANLQSAVLPNGLTTIEAWAFWDCDSLQSVYLPDTLTGIAYRAFDRCWELTDVYYEGSERQWQRLPVAPENDDLDLATLHCDYRY